MTNKGLILLLLAGTLFMSGCRQNSEINRISILKNQLLTIVDDAPGTVGIAIVGQDDTITINNSVHYPLMSVFKLHEALAVADALEKKGYKMDSVIYVSTSEIDQTTWSPMLKVFGDGNFDICIRDLVDYAIKSSNNNASNILFQKIVSPEETKRFIKRVATDTTFNISLSEAEMKLNHELSCCNYSTPLSAALLIMQVFNSEIVDADHQNIIKEALAAVTTGHDRLGTAIENEDNIFSRIKREVAIGTHVVN